MAQGKAPEPTAAGLGRQRPKKVHGAVTPFATASGMEGEPLCIPHMIRLSVFLLSLSLAACDAGAPQPSASADAPITLVSQKGGDDAFLVTENAAVRAAGEAVLLRINGETVELSVGEAYLIGEALTRVGYDAMDLKTQEALAPTGGPRCSEPPPGSGVTAIAGRMFKRCPPPPPPPFMEIDLLERLIGTSTKIVEAPEDAQWERIPGGLVSEF